MLHVVILCKICFMVLIVPLVMCLIVVFQDSNFLRHCMIWAVMRSPPSVIRFDMDSWLARPNKRHLSQGLFWFNLDIDIAGDGS